MKRANEIVRLSENRRYRFLEINLALVTAFSFLLVYIFDNFNDAGKWSMITSMIIYFILTLANIIYNLRENRTKGIRKSICEVRGWKYHRFGRKMMNIKNYNFEEDYKTQIINLHKYQQNYNKIGRNTRTITFTGLIILLITFIISITINSLELTNLDQCGIISIIFFNVIPSIGIIGIIFYFKWYREKKLREKVEFIEIPIPKGEKKEYKELIDNCIEDYKEKKNKSV